MGANVYLESVASYGYSGVATSVTCISQDIPGRTGKRIAIRAFGFMSGGTASKSYFMQSLGKTTLLAVVASAGSTLSLSGEPGPSGNSLAAGDYIAVIQDNGTYHFSKVGAVTGLSGIVLCTVIGGAAAIGQTIYDLGVYSDTGHIVYRMNTTSSENSKELDGGVFYGTEKGSPMKVWNDCDASGSEAINYLTVGYLNK